MSEGKMIITRKIPARTKVIVVEWCKKEWMLMSQRFRDIRARTRNPMDKCGICKHEFEDGEMMGLACFESSGNKTVCQSCADELIASKTADST